MRRLALSAFFFAIFLPCCGAQVFLGAEAGPDSFLKNDEPAAESISEDAFAWSLSSQISSAALCAVFESTSSEKEIMKYLRSGMYRQELVTLMLLSEEKSVPFSRIVSSGSYKDGGMRAAAAGYGADLMGLFRRASVIKAEAERDMPLFTPSEPEVRKSTVPASGPAVKNGEGTGK